MSNYTMPPRGRASDYAKGKISQDEIIALQIANDANISKARKAYQLGEKEGAPKPIPQESASPDELLADDASQEATAMSNVRKLGFRDQEVAAIITNIRAEANLDFTTLNANFPAIEADVKKRFNVRLLTPAFFLEYLKKYSEELAGAAGMRVFAPNNGGLNGLVNNVAELRAIIPDRAEIEFIRQRAIDSGVVGQRMLGDLQRLEFLLPSAADMEALRNTDPVRQQRIIDALLIQFQNMPSAAEVRDLARGLEADQVDRRRFFEAITAIIDGAPSGGGGGRQRNIVEDELGSSSSASVARTENLYEEDPRERLKQERDLRAAQTAIQINSDPRTLTADQQAIYAQLTGVRRVAPTLEQLSSITGDSNTTTESLNSAISLDTATLTQIKNTLKLYPDIADRLINLTNREKVNYNDLALHPPASARSRKVGWEDTNLRELFQTKFGRGLLGGKKGMRPIKVGRGIAVKETPSYREYGKYAIHIPQLEQQDILNVKYKSLGQIPKFKPIPVSDIFRDFMVDLIENGKPNARVYTQISPDERKFFEEMSIGAGVWNGLGLKRTTTNTDEEENKRFELLKGEYIAGNNNPKVISELRKLVVKMMSDGRIRKNQGVELLMELSI